MEDSNLQELQKDTFFIVIILTAVAALTLAYWMLLTADFRTDGYDLVWWLPAGAALLTCYLSYKIYRARHFRASTYVFIGGLILSVISFMVWPQSQFHTHQVYLLLLVVAMAGLLINPQAAASTATYAVIATLVAAFSWQEFAWTTLLDLLPPLLMTYGMAAVSWVSSSHLTTTLQWAMDSQSRAQERSRELFESQQELEKAYTMLETTNIRLREAEAEAVRANQFKTRFITNLSHELRTPLSAIINFSFILSRKHHGEVTKEQQDYLDRIHGAGNLLLEIVNDLLDLAKIEAGQMELFREPVDIAAIGRSVMSTVPGLVTDQPIELRQEIEADLPPVNGDGTRIRQILLNLVGNAIKYTDEGSVTLRIVQEDETFVKISVSDTGIGIKPEDFRRIFEEFQQTEDAFAMRRVGTGLGLPISKKFTELHGGKLWVESKYGQGSTFYCTLPIFHHLETESEQEFLTQSEIVPL